MTSPIRLEFHCHTIYSKDSLTRPERLVASCREKGIDRLVVTDHNTIAGALKARKLAPDLIIVGVEIRAQEGELLAAFVTEEIPKGLPAEETIAILRDQGAFISVSHPFDLTRSGHWDLPDLERIAPLVDAVEIFNARCLSPAYDRRAQAFAETHGLLGTAGSDAHGPIEIGQATMQLPDFEDAAGLKAALKVAKFDLNRSPAAYRLISRWAVIMKSLGFGR